MTGVSPVIIFTLSPNSPKPENMALFQSFFNNGMLFEQKLLILHQK
jgi:hypothetical protein